MTYGSLFTGIGGLDLGLDRAGMECRWQVEVKWFNRAILRQHWPDVPKYRDVHQFPPRKKLPPPVDLICGGFPCQDASVANVNGSGINGSRTGLWTEFARIVGVFRPRFVLVENVPGLLRRGFGRVIGDLASLGYDAEWDCIPASAFGAPHRRDRLWIIAYATSGGFAEERPRTTSENGSSEDGRKDLGLPNGSCGLHAPFPNPLCSRRNAGCERARRQAGDQPGSSSPIVPQSRAAGLEGRRIFGPTPDRAEWLPEPDVCRVAHGVPAGVHRLESLGNAVVPIVGEWFGRRILEAANREESP